MRLSHSLTSAILIPVLIGVNAISAPALADPAGSDALHVTTQSRNGAFIVTVTDETGTAVPDAAIAVRLPETGQTGTFADGTHAAVAYTDRHGEARVPVASWSKGDGTVPVKITVTKGAERAGMLFEQQLAHDEAPRPLETAIVAPKPAPAIAPKPVPQVTVVQPGRTQAALGTPVTPPAISPAAQDPGVPMVSITHGPTHEHFSSGSHKKWIILAAVVGAGAGVAFVLAERKSGSNSSSSSTSALTIGSPTVSVGAP